MTRAPFELLAYQLSLSRSANLSRSHFLTLFFSQRGVTYVAFIVRQ